MGLDYVSIENIGPREADTNDSLANGSKRPRTAVQKQVDSRQSSIPLAASRPTRLPPT